MISNNYSDMSYNYPLYQHDSLYSSPPITTSTLSKKSIIQPSNNNNNVLLTDYNNSMIMNNYSNNPPFLSNMNTQQQQQQYYYQPLKLNRTNNDLMLSHENLIQPYCQRNTFHESGVSVDSYRPFNTMYPSIQQQEKYRFSSSPPFTSNSSLYHNQSCISNNKPPMCESNHYRRSSNNTSRSSSPSFHDSFISRSPSPVNNKRYSCRLCNKRFTRPSSLNTHIYSHTGEKPFKCAVEGCGRNFSVVSNLRRHAKVHNNNPSNSNSTSTSCSF